MKFNITLEQLEEMVECIVICGLDVDEANTYAKNVLMEFNDVEDVVLEPVKQLEKL